jgi:hypothetical protein
MKEESRGETPSAVDEAVEEGAARGFGRRSF